MNEITSFNQLFVESARRGLRLNNFFQLENGWFRCSWRAGEWVGAFYDDKTPFLAALNAYVLADLQAPHSGTHGSPELDEDAAKLIAFGQDPGPTDADLFG